MIRIDGFYLYTVGYAIHPVSELQSDVTFQDWVIRLFVAQNALETLLQKSVFQLRTSITAGGKLLSAIKALTADPQRTTPIDFMEAYLVTSSLTEFEHVLAAEFGLVNIYLVVKKRGYDTNDLIHNGEVIFPDDLRRKVPEALADVAQATRCIAFELPTAAAFHLHRANESVLHHWYDSISNGRARPTGRNIGDYLKVLNENNLGSSKVRSALKDLKDLHRNPLIHPEDSLESIDEAIALLGSIQAVIVTMLRDIPDSKTGAELVPVVLQ